MARRLGADPVALVFSARDPGAELASQPALSIEGLQADHARALLDSALAGPLDARVRDLIVAETRGNPLALLELPRGLTPAELAGGFGLPAVTPLTSRIEDSFTRQVEALPAQTRRLLQLAAADPSGDRSLLWRAAERLGLGVQAGRPAVDAGLVEFDGRVRFRHPLTRSAAYRSASLAERHELHAALAAVTDPQDDPDRRAWHLAQATSDYDEEVAVELERSAGRAQARGGVAAAAAFLERAALLTGDPARRAGRALTAAQAKVQAGAAGAAQDLLAVAPGPRLSVTWSRPAWTWCRPGWLPPPGATAKPRCCCCGPLSSWRGSTWSWPAPPTWMPWLRRSTPGGCAGPGSSTIDVARVAAAAPRPPGQPRPPDLLLDGLTALFTQGYTAALPLLRQGVAAAEQSTPADEEPHWLWLACVMASQVWDDERWEVLARRYVQLVRQLGALAELPLALDRRIRPFLFAGELTAAAALLDETRTVEDATGNPPWHYGALSLAAFRGNQDTAAALITSIMRDVTQRGEGYGIACAEWAKALLCNGLGLSRDAVAAAERAAEYHGDLGFYRWALVELVEAATRSGMTETAADAYRQAHRDDRPGRH